MPGAELLGVKLSLRRDPGAAGGQVSGASSGGELINAIAGAIYSHMTADDIAAYQTGTHPGLTASPITYQLVNAAELAIAASKQ